METQIATTIDQSKLLLEAGLSPDSADMCTFVGGNPARQVRVIAIGEYRLYGTLENTTPLWSLSRLIDIHGHFQIGVIDNSEELIESLVKSIILLISYGDINKEYLKR